MTLYDEGLTELPSTGSRPAIDVLMSGLTPKKKGEVEDLLMREPRLPHSTVATVLNRHFPQTKKFTGTMVARWRTNHDGI